MKKNYIFRIFSLNILLICLAVHAYAQPAGANITNPIEIGTLGNSNTTFNDTQSNSTSNGFGNNYGQASDDIFYRFTINSTTLINISHCSSGFDTYMHLLDANGNLIVSNDDNGPLCAGLQSSISISLNAGSYFVVSEGYGYNSGFITTNVTGSFTNNSGFATYTEFIDNEMRFLDKSEITTGILYDRVNSLAGLNDFNITQADTSSNKHFRQSYFEMKVAAYNSNNWMPMEDLNDLTFSKKSIGQVPIGLSNYSYNLIDTNAIANNLFYFVDSVLFDTPNRISSPYLLLNNFVASPLLDSVPLNFSYYIGTEFLIQQASKTINNLQIDFGDGVGLRTITLNSSVPVNYQTYGFKYLKFIIGFNDNTSLTSYAIVKCVNYNLTIPQANGLISVQSTGGNPSTQNCNLEAPSFIKSKIAFQGYDEQTAIFGQGNVRTYYATNGTCDGIIRKPIIVIDGFDPGDTRSIEKLYDKELNNTGFADNLRAEGFDIVILNFPTYTVGTRVRFPRPTVIPITIDGGADYIERNAMTLVALIDSINTVKQGSEKLIIIGPSMGGLISRYALNYMEQNAMPHKTKLWVSFDSPHKGANIPIGDQKFLEFFSSLSASAKENLDNKIGSVAARQMLLHHYTDGTPNPQVPMAHSFRAQFLSSPYMAGFPNGDTGQQFRKIALIDGSLGGNDVNTAGQKAFTFDTRHVKTRLFFFKVKIKTFTIASAKMYFTPSYGSTNDVLTAFKPIKNSSYSVIAQSYSSGYDNAPGGTFNTQEVLQQEGTGIIGSASSHTIAGKLLNIYTGGILNAISTFYSVIPNHSFINTKSALAFTGQNQNLSENVSTRNLVCTNETPFDSYFGDFNTNRQHVQLWAAAVSWITQEINGNPQLPSVKPAYVISGPSTFCTEELYTINGLPPGTTVTWTATGNISIPPSSTGSSVLVSGNIGNGLLKATFNSSSCIQNITKDLTVGAIPIIPNIFSNGYITDSSNPFDVSFDICGSSSNNTVILDFPGAYNLQASVVNPQIYGSTLSFQHESYGSFLVYLEYDTDCGHTYQYLYFNNICPSNYRFSIYPNPADNEFIVSYDNINESVNEIKTKIVIQKNFKVELLNIKGEIIMSSVTKENEPKLVLDTKNIPNGTYYLHITDGKETIKKQIIIKH